MILYLLLLLPWNGDTTQFYFAPEAPKQIKRTVNEKHRPLEVYP